MSVSTATTSTYRQRHGDLHPLAIPTVFLSIFIYAIYCAVIEIGTGSLIERLALVELESALKTTSDQDISSALDTIRQGRNQSSLVGLFPTSSFEEGQRDAVITIALHLRAALLNGEKPAEKLALQEFHHGFLSSNHVLARALGDSLRNLRELLKKKISAYQNARANYRTARETKHRLAEELRNLSVRFDLITQDLKDLFSLSEKMRNQFTPFTFYSLGALSELPFLAGIPDNLSDYVELRNVLEKQGGKVRIEGDNAHELFLAKLDSLRVLSREIAQIHRELENTQSNNLITLKSSKEQLHAAKEALISITNQLIITLIQA
jgi:hypothetical protein